MNSFLSLFGFKSKRSKLISNLESIESPKQLTQFLKTVDSKELAKNSDGKLHSQWQSLMKRFNEATQQNTKKQMGVVLAKFSEIANLCSNTSASQKLCSVFRSGSASDSSQEHELEQKACIQNVQRQVFNRFELDFYRKSLLLNRQVNECLIAGNQIGQQSQQSKRILDINKNKPDFFDQKQNQARSSDRFSNMEATERKCLNEAIKRQNVIFSEGLENLQQIFKQRKRK